ncbi:hypothetical protein V496_04031 [Pseudogymnoascus sp. VKM F-4515 (FW-2607)]|nr:hypothetical protein V496_04031 [Pseudogymnoascus sp. VKM F-4515 (FW-2607)]KFY82939.1 hypothetical protein V498_08390 [Pseudogymnoascus sp. VKM F-4517 (FW-2822)]
MSYGSTAKGTSLVPALLVQSASLVLTARTVGEDELPSRAVLSSYTTEVPARKGLFPPALLVSIQSSGSS